MLDMLKKMVRDRNINLLYCNIIKDIEVVYVEKDDIKLLMILEEIEGTEKELNAIALGIGYYESMKELGKMNHIKADKELIKQYRFFAESYRKNSIKNKEDIKDEI